MDVVVKTGLREEASVPRYAGVGSLAFVAAIVLASESVLDVEVEERLKGRQTMQSEQF